VISEERYHSGAFRRKLSCDILSQIAAVARVRGSDSVFRVFENFFYPERQIEFLFRFLTKRYKT
jgi:hypothetical protein